MQRILLAALAATTLSGTAHATELLYAVDSVKTSDTPELGRPARNGMPSTWISTEAYPGILATTAATTYYYKSYAFDFAPNAFQDVYYEISVYDESNRGLFFASAYKDSSDPATRAADFIGDEGSSGNIQFSANDPGDARSFQVIVPAGHQLVVEFNTTGGGTSGTGQLYDLAVDAFSDTGYSEDFLTAPPPAPVPEVATWGMMMLGMGAVGWAVRRKVARLTRPA